MVRFLRKAEVILILNSLFFVLLNYIILKLIFWNQSDLGALLVLAYAEVILLPLLWICSIISYFVVAKKLGLDRSKLAFIFAALSFPITLVALAIIYNFASNLYYDATRKPIPINSNSSTISSLDVRKSDCMIVIATTSGETLIEGFAGVAKAPNCPNLKYVVSSDRKFAAMVTASGGIDTAITVYSASENKSWQLTVLGSVAAQDMLFLPGDRLAVLISGASDMGKGALWVTVYNLNNSSSVGKPPIPPTDNVSFDQVLEWSNGILKVVEKSTGKTIASYTI